MTENEVICRKKGQARIKITLNLENEEFEELPIRLSKRVTCLNKSDLKFT